VITTNVKPGRYEVALRKGLSILLVAMQREVIFPDWSARNSIGRVCRLTLLSFAILTGWLFSTVGIISVGLVFLFGIIRIALLVV
jgi:hypothetical protein